jgi:hypothetical protein
MDSVVARQRLGQSTQLENFGQIRVARWFIFRLKIPIWANFGGFFSGAVFCGYLGYIF